MANKLNWIYDTTANIYLLFGRLSGVALKFVNGSLYAYSGASTFQNSKTRQKGYDFIGYWNIDVFIFLLYLLAFIVRVGSTIKIKVFSNMARQFYRTNRGRVLAGVCSGLGSYFNVDPLLIRIAFIVLFITGGLGGLIYLLLAIISPLEENY